MYLRFNLTAFILLTLFSINAKSQERSFGLFNSPKGFGISADFQKPSGREVSCINVFADMTAVYSDRASSPGIKIQGSKERILGSWDIASAKALFHTGPGISLGYVRDYSKDHSSPMGFELSMMADAGFKVLFDRGFSIDLSFALELGVFLTRAEGEGAAARIYKNGGLQFILPQLKISKKF